jgi:cysteine desulfurase
MFGKRRIYLDSAAGVAGNPSSPHEEGRRAKKMLEDARTAIARFVEVQADDVLFTSGATESNALAILGYVRGLRERAGLDAPGRNNMHVLYLPSAHASIIENVTVLADEGVSVEPLPIKDARVDTGALAKMIRPETVLVTMDAVCGETGVVWNTREVAEVLKESRRGKIISSFARVHVDASQAPWTEKITRDHFGADMLTLDASKVGALRGCGALIAHRTIPLTPLYRGGGQERGIRSGTEAPELAALFATSLMTVVRGRDAFRVTAEKNRIALVKFITQSIPQVVVNEGRASAQAANILNLSLPGRDTDYLIALLDEVGYAISSRSACETDSETGSRAVFALTGDRERARTTLRISWGPRISSRELTHFSKALAEAVAFVDSNSQR